MLISSIYISFAHRKQPKTGDIVSTTTPLVWGGIAATAAMFWQCILRPAAGMPDLLGSGVKADAHAADRFARGGPALVVAGFLFVASWGTGLVVSTSTS